MKTSKMINIDIEVAKAINDSDVNLSDIVNKYLKQYFKLEY